MPRETLDRKIQQLNDDILILGSMVEQAVLEAVDALRRRDLDASHRIFTGDREINRKRFSIEATCAALIATQQPTAHYLRRLVAILEVNTELERMGDYAKGIAHINRLIGYELPIRLPVDIPRMADSAVSMLHRALIAFVDGDVNAARAIPTEDDQVDALYNRVYRELVVCILGDNSLIDGANYLLWAAHNLERMADRVTNICERTVYAVTGELIEMDFSDDVDMVDTVPPTG